MAGRQACAVAPPESRGLPPKQGLAALVHGPTLSVQVPVAVGPCTWGLGEPHKEGLPLARSSLTSGDARQVLLGRDRKSVV